MEENVLARLRGSIMLSRISSTRCCSSATHFVAHLLLTGPTARTISPALSYLRRRPILSAKNGSLVLTLFRPTDTRSSTPNGSKFRPVHDDFYESKGFWTDVKTLRWMRIPCECMLNPLVPRLINVYSNFLQATNDSHNVLSCLLGPRHTTEPLCTNAFHILLSSGLLA